MLGHKVPVWGIEADWVKIEAIEKLPPPTSVKAFGLFSTMQDFIKDLSKTS